MLTRFAPSPTGFLHIGNMRTALLCYLYAKKTGGQFMLRIDDTDAERSTQEYAEAIQRDLKWLGLEWDVFSKQSERFDAYAKAVEKLKADGRLYACYETQEELEMKRKMQLSSGKPPVYDRAALKLTDEEKAGLEAEGKAPHWRFLLNDEPCQWVDEVRGKTCFDARTMSDPILIRGNGVYTYMLPSTVDDIDFKVSHVLRGEDHVSNTAIQIQIFKALGGDLPIFVHNSLIKTKDGKLSKRTGSSSIADLRESGIEPIAIASFLAKVGSSDPIDLASDLKQLVVEFDISKFGKSPTIYAMEDIERLNIKWLHGAVFEDVKAHLKTAGYDYIDADFWGHVQANLESFDEIADWWRICKEPLTPVIDSEDGEFISNIKAQFPEGNITTETWSQWLSSIKNNTDRKGKQLFMPIRKALTAMEHGPELKDLLPLIGRESILKRLNGEAA